MSWSDTLTDEGYRMTATVCLAHGRFVPCRKQGPHEYSDKTGDVAMVRYYQHMSAREARTPAAEPEYEEETARWQDRYLCITEQYGESRLTCGGHVLVPLHRNSTPVTMVLQACSVHFDGWTLRMLSGEVEAHFTTVKHYQFKVTGRKRNAEPGTSRDSTG